VLVAMGLRSVVPKRVGRKGTLEIRRIVSESHWTRRANKVLIYLAHHRVADTVVQRQGKPAMKKIACYCRVSTRQQKNDSQEAEIRKWLEGNSIDPAQVEWYLDHESGKTLSRPAFDRLQQDIFSGRVKSVVVWKLDRLSRRLRDGVNLLADWCERGLKVVVVTQQIELNGAVGRMIAAVMLGLAEIELEYRRERQMAGIAVARKRGKFLGRKKGTTIGSPDRAKELKQQGLTAPEIAKAMGTSIRTVWRYLGPVAG